jgi:CO/xanthine dehydrogenase FAD-binding subunit
LEFANDNILDDAVIEKIQNTVDGQIAPFTDLRGSEWYKRRMAKLFVKKALAELNGGPG